MLKFFERGAMTKLLLLGGFLGSGKTTLMVNFAKKLEERGLKVTLITNDQGDDLVDTAYSDSLGFETSEITGGCFCCRFPDLLETLKKAAAESHPDLIIAEAVGSCTDLNATVILPIEQFHKDILEVAGFWVLADGARFTGEFTSLDLENPITPLEVLTSHQLQESRVVLLSKTDLIPEQDSLEKVTERIMTINPHCEIIPISSIEGWGFDTLLSLIESSDPLLPLHEIPLDYEVYAEAEAAYGWYNGSWDVRSEEQILPSTLAFHILSLIQRNLKGQGNGAADPIAHAKVMTITAEGALKLSVSGGIIQASDVQKLPVSTSIHTVVNVRAEAVPEKIAESAKRVCEETIPDAFPGAHCSGYREETLIPSPPKPTYRLKRDQG